MCRKYSRKKIPREREGETTYCGKDHHHHRDNRDDVHVVVVGIG